ncbi:MAG TPA: asparagine synthase-related protein [Sporichthya sp.]|nr:asparagine synthase-related protein [Sporichthya sp.]
MGADGEDWAVPSCSTKHHWLAIIPPGSFDLRVEIGSDVPDLDVASRAGYRCVVQGTVEGLPPGRPGQGPAAQLLDAFTRVGDRLLNDVRGFFSFVIADQHARQVLAVRDPLGIYPLFYSSGPAGLLLSPTPTVLIAHPGVDATINRAALADHLRHLWPRPEETFFESVRRIPQGHALRVQHGATTSWRYWDPLFPGRRPKWIDESELGQFDVLLDDAVRRVQSVGRAGIYLSGGLDSVTVAALASDQARQDGLPPPLALSLLFPEPWSEGDLQASVAAQLGLPQVFAELDDAVGPGGLVGAAMRTGWLSAPLQSPWMAAYSSLAGQARQQGCDVIMTGSGGDEWLGVTPNYAADLMRSLRLGELFRLFTAHQRSSTFTPWQVARSTMWRFGLRPLLAAESARIMTRVAPARLIARRVNARRATLDARPWLAPDPALRQQLLDRDEEYVVRSAGEADLLPIGGPREYFRDCRAALSHPLVSMESEEVFEYSRAIGVRVLHPFWDTNLVEFLHATPPRLLNLDGRSKGLIRTTLARRFPALGFERQRKLVVTSFFGQAVGAQAPVAWRESGGARALSDAGIVDPARVATLYADDVPAGASAISAAESDPTQAYLMWEILTTESWLRARG